MPCIKVYGSIWRRELFIAVLCLVLPAFLVNDKTHWPLVIVLMLLGVYLLFVVFRDRLTHRPRLTVTDEEIIINRKGRQEVIRFLDVRSFERETLTLWHYTHYTGSIIVHLKKGNGFVHIINADDLAIKEQVLYDLLCERITTN